MFIPKNQLKKWAGLREQGDLTHMSEESEAISGKRITRQTLALALERGKCNENTYKVLLTFYSRKEEAIHQ